MRSRGLSLAVGISLALLMPAATFAAAAGGSVARYETLSFEVNLCNPSTNWCGNNYFSAAYNTGTGLFSGVGYDAGQGDSYETISGSLIGSEISFSAVQYAGTTSSSGVDFSWLSDSPVPLYLGRGSGTVSGTNGMSAWPIFVYGVATSTTSLPHGSAVSSAPGSGTALTCAGMPVVSKSSNC